MASQDEFGFIRAMLARLPAPKEDVIVGYGDDAAVVASYAGEMLLTTDAMVEDVHFAKNTMSPFDVGYKCVAASISDIAAMGGIPKHVLMTLALPKDIEESFLVALYDGIASICTAMNCSVVGGDVVSTVAGMTITSTLTGEVESGTALLRSGAKPGDVLFATGYLGDAAGGLYVLQHPGVILPPDDANHLVRAHQRPVPQVSAGRVLRSVGASSCNDVSDGLASELNEIAIASSVRLRLDAERIPISPALKALARSTGQDDLAFALYGGEDYQLVGTATPFAFARALAGADASGIRLVQIGRVEAGDGVILRHPDGRLDVLQPGGYNHFRSHTEGV